MTKEKAVKEVLEECRRKGITVEDLIATISAAIEAKTVEPKFEQVKADSIDDKNIEIHITKMFLEIGIPAHVMGYRYLRYAIMYALENPEAIDSMTKCLYPAVSEKFKTTPSGVERAIRSAIEIAWNRGDIDVLNTYFGNTIEFSRGKPTNSEFIAMIVDKLRLERR